MIQKHLKPQMQYNKNIYLQNIKSYYQHCLILLYDLNMVSGVSYYAGAVPVGYRIVLVESQ